MWPAPGAGRARGGRNDGRPEGDGNLPRAADRGARRLDGILLRTTPTIPAPGHRPDGPGEVAVLRPLPDVSAVEARRLNDRRTRDISPDRRGLGAGCPREGGPPRSRAPR